MPDAKWIKGSAKVTLHDHACFAMDPGAPIQAYAEMKEIATPGLSGRTCGYAVRKNIQRSPLLTADRNLLSGSSGTCESDIAAGGASDGA